jgi:hypothetical protein
MAPLTKLIYKPDTQSTEEYMIMINSESVRWAHTLGFNTSHIFLKSTVQEVARRR